MGRRLRQLARRDLPAKHRRPVGGETGRLHVRSVWGTEPTGEKGPLVGELGVPLRSWG